MCSLKYKKGHSVLVRQRWQFDTKHGLPGALSGTMSIVKQTWLSKILSLIGMFDHE